MHNFIEYNITITPLEPWRDIIIAELTEQGFDSFWETDSGIKAYADEIISGDEILSNLSYINKNEVQVNWGKQNMPNINWNEEWEKNFEPINIEDEIFIRADFHPTNAFIDDEIIIQPKMAFGTGHHSTTYLMLKNMIMMDFKDKSVLDMGSGTAVLAIYAKMKGAKYVEAIDNDEWAYNNGKENAIKNNTEINVILGNISNIENKKFDIIIANINKNILLNDIPDYVKCLNTDGYLLMSGIMEKDFEEINILCKKSGLIFEIIDAKNEWIFLKYKKI